MTPPNPRRDPHSTVLAGDISNTTTSTTDDDDDDILRQSPDSPNPLLSPPIPIPDPYGWMRDESRSPSGESYRHLLAENEYTSRRTRHLTGLRETVNKELLGRLKETDYTVPAKHKSYSYYRRTMEGKSYVMHCRAGAVVADRVVVPSWDGSASTPVFDDEDMYLDENDEAEGHDYFATEDVSVSPGENMLAYGVDTSGDEIYELVVKNMTTGEVVLEFDELELDGSVVWGVNDAEIYTVEVDDAQRPYRVWRLMLGDDGYSKEMIFEDRDELFEVGISKTSDERYLLIGSESMETSEYWYLPLDAAQESKSELKCVTKRRKKVLYDVDHYHGQFLIVTNVDDSQEMRLMVTNMTDDNWVDVTTPNGDIIFHDDNNTDLLVESVTPFRSHIVLSGRENGLPRLWIMTLDKHIATSFVPLEFNETAYDVDLGPNHEYNSSSVLISYSSLTTPREYIDVSFQDVRQRTVRKRTEVPGYDPSLYESDRVTVLSRDNKTEIPVSMVYRRATMDQHRTTGRAIPTLLTGYGAYGDPEEDEFDSSVLPLLDRGMLYVIAHVRGGGEKGRQWYEEPNGGKYLCKKNTFFDFVDVAQWLVHKRKVTSESVLACEGRSAGGLLISASLNLDPELFKAAVLGVPFTDVLCTMVDSTIPLTTGEWEEWGNPNEAKYFEYMRSYSPMNNVRGDKRYPSILITGGLNDPRVQYWEPAKYAATLRHEQHEGSGDVLLKIDLTSGHFSASDRYKYLKELSFDYAFLLGELGLDPSLQEELKGNGQS